MNEVISFLNECQVFYIATVEDGKPRVRPFGFVMEFEGKIYFCTNNTKPVYAQMKSVPDVEISAFSPKGQWIRLSGKAVFDDSAAAKARVFEVSPGITGLYKSPDNPIFEIFYLQDAEAVFCSMTEAPRIVKL